MLTVFSRKNLICLALVAIFSFILIYVGMNIDATHAIFGEKNMLNMMAQGLSFTPVEAKLGGYICLALVAFYIFVFAFAITYARRSALMSGRKPYSATMWGIYVAILVACLALSFGLGAVIQKPLDGENIIRVYTFVGECLALSVLVWVALFAIVGAVTMLVVNFRRVGKPFRFFSKESIPVFEDEEMVSRDVTASFGEVDKNAQINAAGGLVSAGATASGGTTGATAEGGIGGVGGGGGNVIAKSLDLDDREKVFPELSKIDVKYGAFDAKPMVSDDINLEQLCTQFRQYLCKKEKLYFDIDTIRFFISGFAASHFEILEGLSGTGKSSLPRYFAKFVSGKVLFMPVQATWRDKSNILGFFNEFSKVYSETEFLTSLYDSSYNSDEINVYVLDELNISRVEYYFADLLSVLEYPVPEWRIKIMNFPPDFMPPLRLIDGYIQIPENSYFVGTANKDDSTFTITDKVYDRAITLDFDSYNDPFEVSEEVGEIHLSGSGLRALYEDALKNSDNKLDEDDLAKLNKIFDFVYTTFDLAVGNRIINQIKTIVPVFMACGGSKEDALDLMLSRKLFAKLEGRFEEYVKPALKDCVNLLNRVYGKGVMKRCEKVINKISRSL